jgi:hypothetical protein
MRTQDLLDPEQWAQKTFGASKLKDMRRTGRAVKAATRMAENASASLPAQMQTWKDVIALYRLLDEEDVTFEALMQPHWQHTRELMEARPVILLVQDTTELDFTHHPATKGLGLIGNHRGRGMFLQTVLAIDASNRDVLGCGYQEPFIRTPIPVGETRTERRKREKETDIWQHCVQAIGSAPAASLWVHVGDRGADMFEFLHTCWSTKTHFVIRAAQDRRVQTEEETLARLFPLVRALPSHDQHSLDVPASHGRKARSTTVHVAWTQVEVLPPRHDARLNKLRALPVWVIRVWEPEAPEGEEVLEWILLTSVPTQSIEEAWERVEWYRARWLVEDYHQCLKTGCRMEERQLQSAEHLVRLLGLLSPVAVRLLQLRDLSRRQPERPAHTVIEADLLAVVAAHTGQTPSVMTSHTFWLAVARMGGHLGRRGDGPPGWKTLWKGWLRAQTLLEGAHLASHLRL